MSSTVATNPSWSSWTSWSCASTRPSSSPSNRYRNLLSRALHPPPAKGCLTVNLSWDARSRAHFSFSAQQTCRSHFRKILYLIVSDQGHELSNITTLRLKFTVMLRVFLRCQRTSARFSRSWCQEAKLRWWWRRGMPKAASPRMKERGVQIARGVLGLRAAFPQWTNSPESASEWGPFCFIWFYFQCSH